MRPHSSGTRLHRPGAMRELAVSDVQRMCGRFLGDRRGELGQAHGRARGVLRARGRWRRRGLLRDAWRGGGGVDRQRSPGPGARWHRQRRSAPRAAGGSRPGHRRSAAIPDGARHGLGCDLQPAQIRLGAPRRRRPTRNRGDAGGAPNGRPVGPGLPGVRCLLDTPGSGWDDAAGGGGVRRCRVRAPSQPCRRYAAAFPRGHRQHDPCRWALDDARWSRPVREPQDRVGALSRRAPCRDDTAAGSRMGAGRAGQAGRGNQRRPPGRPARPEPSPSGDRAAHGGSRRVQPARRPGSGAGHAQGQGLRPRSARHRPRAAHADRREGVGPGRACRGRRPSAAGATHQGRAGAHVTRAARAFRNNRAPIHVLAPRRHPAVGDDSTATANPPTGS